jgi:hypothetical protein
MHSLQHPFRIASGTGLGSVLPKRGCRPVTFRHNEAEIAARYGGWPTRGSRVSGGHATLQWHLQGIPAAAKPLPLICTTRIIFIIVWRNEKLV